MTLTKPRPTAASIMHRHVTEHIDNLENAAFLNPATAITWNPLVRIRDLVEAHRVREAREYLASIPFQPHLEPELQGWRRVLAPPVVRRRPSSGSGWKVEFAWLRENAARYRGKWVALTPDGLVAASDTYRELQTAVAALDLSASPLIHKIT